jgi:hypothetical protein
MEILKLNLNKATPDRPGETEIRFQVALLAAVAALVSSFVARFVFDAPLVPELLAQLVFAVAPIWMVEIAVGMLGTFAKHLAFLGCTVLYLMALMGAAIGYLRYAPRRDSRFAKYALPITFALLIWAMTVFIFLPRWAPVSLAATAPGGTNHIVFMLIHIFYGIALLRRRGDTSISSVRWCACEVISRRRVIRIVGYGVLAVGIYDIGKSLLGSWLRSGSGRVRNGDGVFPNIDGLALEITPTSDFYQVSKNAFDPQVDVHRWNSKSGAGR